MKKLMIASAISLSLFTSPVSATEDDVYNGYQSLLKMQNGSLYTFAQFREMYNLSRFLFTFDMDANEVRFVVEKIGKRSPDEMESFLRAAQLNIPEGSDKHDRKGYIKALAEKRKEEITATTQVRSLTPRSTGCVEVGGCCTIQ